MVWVHARRGPLAGRRVEIPDDELEAATADDGWAQPFEPGTVLGVDTVTPLDPKWKIPGVEIVEGKTVKGGTVKAETEKTASKKKSDD